MLVKAENTDGIKKKTDPGDPVNENIYKMSESARHDLGIKFLPGSLEESLEALKIDRDYLKVCFHDELIETHLALKQQEIAQLEDRSRFEQFMLYHDI